MNKKKKKKERTRGYNGFLVYTYIYLYVLWIYRILNISTVCWRRENTKLERKAPHCFQNIIVKPCGVARLVDYTVIRYYAQRNKVF